MTTTTTPTTVREYFEMACPKCGKDSALCVSVPTWVNLVPDGTDATDDDAHEWTDHSAMLCKACAFNGVVADFAIRNISRRAEAEREQISTYEEKTRQREEVSTSENCCATVEARVEYAWEVMRHAEERGHVDDMASVVDVVTNLLHHAEAIGDDGEAVDDLLRVARMHWAEERHGGESHGE